jgi:hypothetical protein
MLRTGNVHKMIVAALAGAAMAATLGVGAASAAPAGVGSAQDTVAALESSGFRVVVDKIGERPLNQCTVAAVAPGQNATQPVSNGNEIANKTVHLTAKC